MSALPGALDVALLVVTAAAGEARSGCLVGFATQCSLEPERFLVCLSRANRTYEVAREATTLGVHVLGDGQVELARWFGGTTDDQVDKLAAVDWHPGDGGAPLLVACAAWAEMRVLEQLPLGDHVGFLVEAVASGTGDHRGSLRLSDVGPLAPGHPGDDPPREHRPRGGACPPGRAPTA